jgi:predicted dinucleotide-binding enzyme
MSQLYAKLCPKLKQAKFATMTDLEALLAVQSEMVTVRVLVATADIVAHATMNGYRHKITIAAANASHPCQGLAIDIAAYIDSLKIQNVDMDLPETQGMLAAMVQCGFATQQQVASLDALANKQVSWAESEGLPAIDLGHIVSAREINNGTA